jgi:transcription elongation factor S-II
VTTADYIYLFAHDQPSTPSFPTFIVAMDAKEIELRGKAITKAMQESEPSSSLLKLLGDLKTGVSATEDLLRQTRIGVTINRLRTHKDPAVSKLATELVSKWRDEVKKGPKKNTPAKVADGSASPAPAPSGTASPAPVVAAKKHNVDPEKRNHKTDKIKYQVTGHEARDGCVRLMYDGMAFMSAARKYRHVSTLRVSLTHPQHLMRYSASPNRSKMPPTTMPAA